MMDDRPTLFLQQSVGFSDERPNPSAAVVTFVREQLGMSVAALKDAGVHVQFVKRQRDYPVFVGNRMPALVVPDGRHVYVGLTRVTQQLHSIVNRRRRHDDATVVGSDDVRRERQLFSDNVRNCAAPSSDASRASLSPSSDEASGFTDSSTETSSASQPRQSGQGGGGHKSNAVSLESDCSDEPQSPGFGNHTARTCAPNVRRRVIFQPYDPDDPQDAS